GSVASASGPVGGGGGGAGVLGGGGGGSGEISVANGAGGAGARSKRPAIGLTDKPAGTGSGDGADGGFAMVWTRQAVGGPSWPGQDIARGVGLYPAHGGYVVDAYGGLHPFTQGSLS